MAFLSPTEMLSRLQSSKIKEAFKVVHFEKRQESLQEGDLTGEMLEHI